MTSTDLVKSSKAVKGSTNTVRQHLDAVERARELYLAQIKRAEAEYFDRIKRATDIISGAEPSIAEPDKPAGNGSPEQPAQQAATG